MEKFVRPDREGDSARARFLRAKDEAFRDITCERMMAAAKARSDAWWAAEAGQRCKDLRDQLNAHEVSMLVSGDPKIPQELRESMEAEIAEAIASRGGDPGDAMKIIAQGVLPALRANPDDEEAAEIGIRALPYVRENWLKFLEEWEPK